MPGTGEQLRLIVFRCIDKTLLTDRKGGEEVVDEFVMKKRSSVTILLYIAVGQSE